MKNEILKWRLIVVLMLTASLSFAQNMEKVVTPHADSVVTGADVHQIRVDSAVDYRRFKAGAEFKISENEKNINLLRNQKSNITQETRERYNKNLMILHEKNAILKTKVGVSGQTATAEWATFKREINQNLMELSRAITIAAKESPL